MTALAYYSPVIAFWSVVWLIVDALILVFVRGASIATQEAIAAEAGEI